MPNLEAMSQISGPTCQTVASGSRRKRNLGTTLIEILVVIVVFLIGILAVIQIFPKGFQLLLLNRSKIVAQTLARDYSETLKARPDELPEQIVSAYYDGSGNLIINSAKDPNDLSTLGVSLNSNGLAADGSGVGLGSWQYYTASNIFRRVIGEGRRVPAPRAVGSTNLYFGGLMVLQFGPIDFQPAKLGRVSNLVVYGNDLQQIIGIPAPQVLRTDYQYFVSNPNNNQIALTLPSGLSTDADRQYRVSFSAYLSNGSGGVVKRDYTELLPIVVQGQAGPDASGQLPYSTPRSLVALVGDPILSVDLNTLRVQRIFQPILKTDANQVFSATDPYQYKLLNENLGVLLFNPIGNGRFVSRQGHDREPLTARVNYDVFDWRILHDDFRIDAGVLPGEPSAVDPQALIAQHKLPIGSLKVSTIAGPDGLPNEPIANLEITPDSRKYIGSGYLPADTSNANGPGVDNFVLLDVETGGVYCEVNTADRSQQLITVNKTTGVVSINDLDGDASNGITGELLMPDGSTVNVQMDNRAVRALYRVNQEYSLQVFKAASQYTISPTAASLSVGQFYVGGTVTGAGQSTRIYFSNSDNGRKVTVGELTYASSVDNQVHSFVGQDFLIKKGGDPSLNLPYIDLTDVDPYATAVNFRNGIGVRGVKGASVAVRVLWNPTTFRLTPDSATNLSHLNQWAQNWRKTTNEMFLQKQDVNR